MSTASKVTLLTSVCGTLGIIYYVHLTQVKDRERLHRVRRRKSFFFFF